MFPHTRADFLFSKTEAAALAPGPAFSAPDSRFRYLHDQLQGNKHVTCSSSKLIGCVMVSVIFIGSDCRNAICCYGTALRPATSSVDHTWYMIPSADRET